MIKNLYLLSLLLLASTLNAQLDMSNLKPTSPPAAVLLGYGPTTIDNISSPQAISSALQNAVTASGAINPNFNVEASPYWLLNLKNQSINKILEDNNWFRNVWRTLNFSFATSETDTMHYGNFRKGLAMAGGIRISLFNGMYINGKAKTAARQYEYFTLNPFHNLKTNAEDIIHTVSRVKKRLTADTSDAKMAAYKQSGTDSLYKFASYALTGSIKHNAKLDTMYKSLCIDSLAEELAGIAPQNAPGQYQALAAMQKKYPKWQAVVQSIRNNTSITNDPDAPVSKLLENMQKLLYVPSGDSIEKAWQQQIDNLYNKEKTNNDPDAFYADVVKVLTLDTALSIKYLITLVDTFKNPVGFNLDLNAAASGILPGDSVQHSSFAQFGVWLVPSYRKTFDIKTKKGKSVSGFAEGMLILPRFIYNYHSAGFASYVDTANYVDLGAKADFTINNFSASVEGVWRDAVKFPTHNYNYSFDHKYTWHITASVDYKVSTMFDVQMSFGRNFNGKVAAFDGALPGALYYVAGLNFNLAGAKSSKSN